VQRRAVRHAVKEVVVDEYVVKARKRGTFTWYKIVYQGDYSSCCQEQLRLFNDGYDAKVCKA